VIFDLMNIFMLASAVENCSSICQLQMTTGSIIHPCLLTVAVIQTAPQFSFWLLFFFLGFGFILFHAFLLVAIMLSDLEYCKLLGHLSIPSILL
jgi:hypothetical protein